MFPPFRGGMHSAGLFPVIGISFFEQPWRMSYTYGRCPPGEAGGGIEVFFVVYIFCWCLGYDVGIFLASYFFR